MTLDLKDFSLILLNKAAISFHDIIKFKVHIRKQVTKGKSCKKYEANKHFLNIKTFLDTRQIIFYHF